MLCKNCGRHIDINIDICKCGVNPFGENKNDFNVIERILNGEDQAEPSVQINLPKVRACTKHGGNDGAIYDIDERFEVSIDNGSSFESAPRVMAGLPAGSYIFRDKTDNAHEFSLTVHEPKNRSFLIAAVVVPICLLLVILAVVIADVPQISISVQDNEKKTTSSLAEDSADSELKEMIVYNLEENESKEQYLNIYNENCEPVRRAEKLNNGSNVKVNINNNFTKKGNTYYFAVDYNGYINSSFIIEYKKENVCKYRVSEDSDFYKGASKSGKKYNFKIYAGKSVTYYKDCVANGLYMVKYGDDIGYIETEPMPMYIFYYINYKQVRDKDYVAVYEEDSTDSRLDKIETDGSKAIKVTVLKESGEFYYVDYNGATGYILKKYLTESKKKATSATTTTTTARVIVTQPSTTNYQNNYNNQSPGATATSNAKVAVRGMD